MEFGEKVKKARQAKGLTQKELAKLTGIAERTIQNYELGERRPKKQETYGILASVLGIPEGTLLDDTEEFILEAQERYGGRGRKQAEEIIKNFRVAAAGGELDDDDLEFIKEAMMQTYRDAKKYNQRFANHRYQDKDSDQQD